MQSLHSLLPAASAYVPALQEPQLGPAVDEYVPAAQSSHRYLPVVALRTARWPGPQLLHVSASIAACGVPAAADNPRGHAVQAAAPLGEYLPTGQFRQLST